MSKILAIDFGLARIGLAYSDKKLKIALPYKTILAKKDNLKETVELVVKEIEILKDVEEIVIGLPLLLTGKESPMCEPVRKFAQKLQEKVLAKIILLDERLTSSQAEKSLKEISHSRKERTKHTDQLAAAILLQNYLDSSR
jgi:putative Holliday junction resolvase